MDGGNDRRYYLGIEIGGIIMEVEKKQFSAFLHLIRINMTFYITPCVNFRTNMTMI